MASQLGVLQKIFLPRRYLLLSPDAIYELHMFSDASERAIVVCVYLRSYNQNNEYYVSFVAGKSRVLTIKQVEKNPEKSLSLRW